MDRDEFSEYFKVLDKVSERLRKVIYALIIVYVAMFLYGLSAFLYPSNQYAYDDLNKQVRCIYAESPAPECVELQKYIEEHKITPNMRSDIDVALWEHQLQDLYDDSVKNRFFSFPIFGLQTDRDLVWVLFPLVGIIGYYIMLLSLSSMVRLFHFLMDRNELDPFRLRLIQSTLVITVPLQDTKTHREFGDIDPVTKWMWKVLALLVLAIPILVSILMIVDQSNVLAVWLYRTPGEGVFTKFSAGFKIELATEVLLIALEATLAWSVIKAGLDFGKCQSKVATLIKRAEG
jgi:hypothetical protein